MKTNIGIDIGGTFLSIFKDEEGIVFKEPNLISVQKNGTDYSVIALGYEAKKLQGKTNENVLTFSPASEGIIKSVDYQAYYLKNVLKKVFGRNYFGNLNAFLSIPCGLSDEEKNNYRKTCNKIGIRKSQTVSAIICAGLGADKQVESNSNFLVIDIGGSKTDVAVVSRLSVVKGASIGIGGRVLDYAITNALKNKYNLLIGEKSASQIKENIASLFPNDTLNMEVLGVNITTKSPQTCVVFSKDIRSELQTYIDEIIKVVKATIQECPTEILQDIMNNGIVLTGGVAELTGLKEYLTKILGITTRIAEKSDTAVITGLGKMI